MKTITAYLAPDGYTQELLNELNGLTQVSQAFERLILTQGPPVQAHWAQNTWLNPQEIPFESIKQATQALKKIQRNWTLYSSQLHRRAQLIADGLPKVSSKPVSFPTLLPQQPMGSWTLLDKNLLLAASECTSPFPNGEIHFLENKVTPPSRAYLKLWEALTVTKHAYPGPGTNCIDMGSSPGGWTWVLHELGASVLSVDRAPLSPPIAALPRVQCMKRDAFTLNPLEVGPVDWFFSDVICYPQKLLELVLKWLDSGQCKNFICTIKFQGKKLSASDHQALQALALIPGSNILHLFHNKHELTWIKLDKK
jgi:23S rRNA (cytidine2498-2'-O)-methyltransferase